MNGMTIVLLVEMSDEDDQEFRASLVFSNALPLLSVVNVKLEVEIVSPNDDSSVGDSRWRAVREMKFPSAWMMCDGM